MVTDVNVPTKINRFFYLKDILIFGGFTALGFLTRDFVNPSLAVAYVIFNAVVGLVMTLPCPFAKRRRMYQALFLNVVRNRSAYHAERLIPHKIPENAADMYLGYNGN